MWFVVLSVVKCQVEDRERIGGRQGGNREIEYGL
jgi:hypothetical protein